MLVKSHLGLQTDNSMVRIPWFVIGNDVKVEVLGCAADYCEFCHAIRQFKISKINWSVSYNLADTYKVSDEYHAQCLRCGLGRKTGIARYPKILPEGAELERAIQETLPGFDQGERDDLENESNVLEGRSSADARMARLVEPFKIVSGFERNPGKQAIGCSKLIFLALSWSIGLGVVGYVVAMLQKVNPQDSVAVGWTVGFVSMIVVSLILRLMSKRYMVREYLEFLPLIAISLAPLKPSDTELTQAFEILRADELPIARALTVREVLDAIALTRE